MKPHFYLFCFSVFLAACGEPNKPTDLSTPKESQQTKSGYEVGRVVERSLASSVRLPGQLKPFNEVEIYAKINSFIQQIYVDRGSVVKKGQLLVDLEAPEMLSQLQSANARYIQASETANASREKYRRLKEASREEGAVSPLDLDNALSKMKGDEAIAQSEKSNVEAMEMVQSYLKIHAPFDGMIVQRNVSAGALVGPGKNSEQPMLVLQDIAKLRLEVHIPENYVDKVDLSKPVSYVFNSQPYKHYEGRISRKANMLGVTQSEAIEIDVINEDQRFKPGMYSEVSIPLLSGASSLLVPDHSIVRSTERQYVIKVEDQKAVFVDIKEGISADDLVEVFGDLSAGDPVILHANDEIKEGTVIE